MKEIHLNRLKIIKTEMIKKESFIESQRLKMDESISMVNLLLEEIKKINNDEKNDLNNKYILLNEKAKNIEKIQKQISSIYNELFRINENWKKDINIIIEQICNEQNISRKQAVDEIEKILK